MSQVITLGVLFLGRKQTKVIIITATANVVGASWPEEEIRRKFAPCFKSRRNRATMIIITKIKRELIYLSPAEREKVRHCGIGDESRARAL